VPEASERGISFRKHLVPALLMVVFCALMIYRLTAQSPEDIERTRARMHLELIYGLQSAYIQEYGTYLPISREKNADILKLNEVPGRFRYRVTVEGSTFVAEAWADLDGDGRQEVWYVDQERPEPVLIQQD
jgi:hypothetical protein